MDRIPIFKVGTLLLVTLQSDVRDKVLESLQGDLGEKIRDTGARGILIDISALQVVDHFTASTLERIAALTGLLGADSVLVGMRPAVALTLMELGMTFEGVATAVNVERGIDLLRGRLASAIEEDDDVQDVDEREIATPEAADVHVGGAGGPEG